MGIAFGSETCTIHTGAKLREKLIRGAEETLLSVGTTFGPYGQNVAITKFYNPPHITKDGTTVANSINLKDPIENITAQAIKQASAETAKLAGDGTTSTALIASALILHSFEYLKDNPGSTTIYRRKLEAAKDKVVQYIESTSVPLTMDSIYHIAMVACNGDTEIATIVTDAFKVIGKEGAIAVEESKTYETTLDAIEGIKLDRSHIIPSLARGKDTTKFKNCNILVTDLDLTTSEDAITLLQLQATAGNPLLLICNDLKDTALTVLEYNLEKNPDIPISVIRAPFIAEARKNALEDLALSTGSKYISSGSGWKLKDALISHLGGADSVTITSKETNIIGRKGDSGKIKERIALYKKKIATDKEGLAPNYKKRLAMLDSGAAIIYVGGATGMEVQEKKDRLDDTIKAVRSAYEKGIVVGGTLTYLEASRVLDSKDEIENILREALKNLTTLLLRNSGKSVEDHTKSIEDGFILDPTLVVTSSVRNGVGAAVMVCTTGCAIEKHESQ